MISFEDAMQLSRTINCEGVYSDKAMKGLYLAATSCPPVGNFVEIGMEFGRSTSLIAQVAKDRRQYFVCCDPFIRHLSGAEGAGVAEHTIGMLVRLDLDFAFLRGFSFSAPVHKFGPIAFLHIDGNHSEPFLRGDMAAFDPFVIDGGYICFHDYGNDGLYSEHVKRILDEAELAGRWKRIGLYDTCLVVERKGAYENYYFPGGGRP